MAEVLVYHGIPGRNNLDLAQRLLSENGIPSRGQLTGYSFATIPPISVNTVWVEEEHLEEASKLIEELGKDGWQVSVQRFPEETQGGDPDGLSNDPGDTTG